MSRGLCAHPFQIQIQIHKEEEQTPVFSLQSRVSSLQSTLHYTKKHITKQIQQHLQLQLHSNVNAEEEEAESRESSSKDRERKKEEVNTTLVH